jgi:hypothetical protein
MQIARSQAMAHLAAAGRGGVLVLAALASNAVFAGAFCWPALPQTAGRGGLQRAIRTSCGPLPPHSRGMAIGGRSSSSGSDSAMGVGHT